MSSTLPSCEYMHAHNELVENVKNNMPSETTLYDLTEVYRVFGDSTRIKILYCLFESEMCVCDIAQLLGMTISAISHQLRVLKQAKLVKFRKEGKTVFYSLSDDHVRTIIGMGIEHISEWKDLKIMRKMINVTGLDCAHCASEFESIVKGCEGIEDAKINFILEKIIVTARDEASIEAALKKAKEKFSDVETN